MMPPRSRVEEVMRQRGVSQAELARALGWHTSNLSRILAGKRELSRGALRPVANALQCEPANMVEPIGAPIPPRSAVEPAVPPDFGRRIGAILTMLGLDRVEPLLEFLATGDYSSMPPPVARRLRNILDAADRHGP